MSPFQNLRTSRLPSIMRAALGAALVIGGLLPLASSNAYAATTSASNGLSFITATSGEGFASVAVSPSTAVQVPIVLQNTSKSTSTGHPSLTFVVSGPVQVASLFASPTSSADAAKRSWKCTILKGKETCVLNGPAITVRPGSALKAYLTLTNSFSGGVAQIIASSISAQGVLPGVTETAFQLLHFSPAPQSTSKESGLQVTESAVSTLTLGSSSQDSFVFKNVQPSALTAVGAYPVATFSSMLAPGIVSSWSLLSPGWKCVGPQNTSPTCTLLATTLASGASTVPLTIGFSLSTSTKFASSTNSLVGTNILWDGSLQNVSSTGSLVNQSVHEQLDVHPMAPGQLSISMRAAGSSSLMRASVAKTFIVDVSSPEGIPTGLQLSINLPTGISSSADATNGWSCPASVGTQVCTHALAIPSNVSSALTLHLQALNSAALGASVVSVIAHSGDNIVSGATATSLMVVDSPGAVLDAHSVKDAQGTAWLTSGSLRQVPVGTPTALYFAISNTSAVALKSGDVVSYNVELSSAVQALQSQLQLATAPVTLSPLAGQSSVCSTSPTGITCLQKLTKDLVRDGPPLVVGFNVTTSVDVSKAGVDLIAPTLAAQFATGVVAELTVGASGDAHSIASTSVHVAISSVVAPTTQLRSAHTASTCSNGTGLALANMALSVTTASLTCTNGVLGGTGTVPLGDSALAVSFTYTDAFDYSFSTNATVNLFGTTTLVSGTITATNGILAGSFTGSVSSISIAGLSISNLAIAYDSGTALTGSATLIAGDTSIAVNFTYTSSQDWTMTAASSVISFLGTSTTLTGTLTNAVATGAKTATLSGSLVSSGFVATVQGVQMTISSVSYAFGATAPGFSATGTIDSSGESMAFTMQYTDTSDWSLSVTSTLSVFGASLAISTPKPLTDVAGAITGKIVGSLSAPVNLGAATLSNFSMSYIWGGKFTGTGTFSVSLPGVSAPMSVTASTTWAQINGVSTVLVDGTMSSGSDGIAGSGISVSTMIYYWVASGSSPTSVTLNGTSYKVPANSLYLAGSATLPSTLANFIGGNFTINCAVSFVSTTNWAMIATVPENTSIPTGSKDFSFVFPSFQLLIGMNTTGLYTTLNESGTLTVAAEANGGTPEVMTVTAAINVQPSTELVSGTVTASGANGQPAWTNAFGVSGFTINTLSFTAGVQGDLPTLGLGFSATLPSSISTILGSTSPIPVVGVANVSDTNLCLDLQIGQQGGPTVISIGGVVDASYADLVIAPSGCTVGAFTVPASYALDFTGSFFSVPVTYASTFTMTPLSYTGSATLGGFSAGGVTFSGASITASLASNGNALVAFSGGLSILGDNITLTGTGSSNPSAGTSSMSLAVSGLNFSLDNGNFSLSNMNFTGAMTQSKSGVSAAISASGVFNLFGSQANFTANFGFTNGEITQLNMDIQDQISLSTGFTATGDFQISADTVKNQYSIALTNGSAVLPGASLTNVSLTWSTSATTFSGTLNVSPLFDATISGAVYTGAPVAGATILNNVGATVAAKQGDFYFSASDITLTLGAFSATGAVTVGNVNGVAFFQANAALVLDNHGDAINVSGNFDTSGNWFFTGNGSLDLAGFGIQIQITATDETTTQFPNGGINIQGNTTVAIANGPSVQLVGSFTKDTQGLDVALTGQADFNVSGFDFGTTQFGIKVSSGDESFDMYASVNLGGVFSGTLNGSFLNIGGNVAFQVGFGVSVNAPGLGSGLSGTLEVGNEWNNQIVSAYALITMNANVFGVPISIPQLHCNPDFSFSYSVPSSSYEENAGAVNFGLFQWQGISSGSFSISVSSNAAPSFSFSGSAQLQEMDYSCSDSWYQCVIGQGWSWGNWYNLTTVSVSADSSGNLTFCWSGSCWSSSLGQNQSPSAPKAPAPLVTSTYQSVFTSPTGIPIVEGGSGTGSGSWLNSTVSANTVTMMAGTSPSACGSYSNQYEVALIGSNGDLWTFGSYGSNTDWGNAHQVMMGTQPSITCGPNNWYEVAYVATDGNIYMAGPMGNGNISDGGNNGSLNFATTPSELWSFSVDANPYSGAQAAPGTSPSVVYTGDANGSPWYEVCWNNAGNNNLACEGGDGWGNTSEGGWWISSSNTVLSLAPGTSPSLGELASYEEFAVAFTGSNGHLQIAYEGRQYNGSNMSSQNSWDTGIALWGGTSPSLNAFYNPTTGAEYCGGPCFNVSYVGSNSDLWTYGVGLNEDGSINSNWTSPSGNDSGIIVDPGSVSSVGGAVGNGYDITWTRGGNIYTWIQGSNPVEVGPLQSGTKPTVFSIVS